MGEISPAKDLFAEAAASYHKLGMPYAILLDSMAGKKGLKIIDRRSIYSSQTVYNLLIGIEDKEDYTEYLWELRHKLDDFRNVRMGVLAIPTEFYLDIFDAFSHHEIAPHTDKVIKAIVPFVQIYTRALQRARSDKYHWERLAMAFHPVEPDIMGLMLILQNIMGRWDISLSGLLEEIGIYREEIEVIQYCIKKLGRHSKDSKINENDRESD